MEQKSSGTKVVDLNSLGEFYGKVKTGMEGIVGQCDGKFPLSSAELDKVYLLPSTGVSYVCTQAFSGKELIVPDSNFVELSVKENSDKLYNLSAFELIKQGTVTDFENATEVFDFSIFHNTNISTSRLEIIVVIHGHGHREWFNTRFTKFATWARPSEEITTIYDHRTGASKTPELIFERNTKKMFIKPVENVANDYDIYVCKFTY